MEEQGAVYSIYQFCTIYTTITSMLWVSVFAVLIIFLGRSLNFKRNYRQNFSKEIRQNEIIIQKIMGKARRDGYEEN